MNTKLDRLTRLTDIWAARILIMVIAAAFILSYAALLALALDAGYSPWLGWLWPLLLDGVVIYAAMSLVKRQFSGQPTRFIWALLIVSDGLSIGLNGYAAWPDLAYVAIHAAPPLVLVLLLKAYTNDAKDDARQANAVATVADLDARITDEAQLLRAMEAEHDRKSADYAAKIEQQAARLAALKEDTRAARSAANEENSAFGPQNLPAANEAKQTRIDARRALVADLARQGLTQADIARQLKAAGHAASPDTIRRDLKALGFGDGPEVVDIFKALVSDLAVATNGAGGDHASH